MSTGLALSMNSISLPAPMVPRFVALSRSAHGAKRWRRLTGYKFAAGQLLAPLAAMELPRTVVSMPVAFARTESGMVPVALMAVEEGSNLFVGPDGRWLGGYVPASVRGTPFAMGRNDQGKLVLCIDENNPQITDDDGDPLFTAQGEPTQELRQAMEFIQRREQAMGASIRACEALMRHQCLAPLVFSAKSLDGRQRRVEGLLQVDEAALNALSDEAFLELRATGALGMAYAQLVSLHKLPTLSRLAQERAQNAAGKPETSPGVMPDLSLFDKDGTFGFDAFR